MALLRLLKAIPADLMLLWLHAYIHEQACMLQECNFGKLLSGTIHAGKSHIVQRFLSCTGLPDQLGLVSCH